MEKIKKTSITKELKKKDCEGYKTDLNHKNAINPGWIPVNNYAKKIKFRYYKGKSGFIWSDWYEIIK